MDLSRLEINRRTALLTSAAIAANVINPMRAFAQETPRKGGVFNVHYGAEQRQLNPSIQASTGVYIIGNGEKLTVALIIVIFVLTVKPAGLFGRVVVKRV